MYIDIFILVLLIGSILGLSVAIIFIVNLYSRLTDKIEETEKEKILLHTNITQKAEGLLSEAHTNNLRIISEANKKAAEIIAEAKQSKTTSDEVLQTKLNQLLTFQEQTFEKLSSDFLKTYQNSLTNLQQQDLEQMKKVSGAIEQSVEKQLSDFSQTLAKETVGMEEDVKGKVEKEFQKAEAEIQTYKQAEFDKIQQELYPLLQQITEKVLGKALTLENHETLITTALEDAKKEMDRKVSNGTNDAQNTSAPPTKES